MSGPEARTTTAAEGGTLPSEATVGGPAAAVRGRSGKILPRHLERLAIVYVRQSSPQQVVEHPESRARQYALMGHAVALGWPKERVLLIDEDQGQSGRGSEHRTGFQRLLGEVATDRVGLILGLEMSRLARSSKDWHVLLEWCALCGALLADQDGIYDPTDTNDRLLLGLKGTMSEFELLTMRNRLQRGALHKAERGELFIAVPCGYLKMPSGEVVLEPDEQARAAVQLVFDKFEELGTLYGVFRYLLRHQLLLGRRVKHGPRRGQLEWHRPSLHGLADMLHHPMYAGAYTFGRRPVDPKRTTASGAKAQRSVPMDEWKVLLRDRLPAYISWERYLANQERLRQNRSASASRGTARQGAALLAGLIVCGTCGCRLQAHYKTSSPQYLCTRHYVLGTPKECYGLKAAVVDELVAQQVLRALGPAALELSLQAQGDVQRERQRLDRHWQQRLERARYESQRAERQYQAVEPENRLVARSLEQRWEEALREQRRLEQEYHNFAREQPPALTQQERERITALSADIPALWQAAGATPADRKEIIRCLVRRVVVQVQKDSERVGVVIDWEGDVSSQHEVVRPVSLYEQLEDFGGLLERVAALRKQGNTAAEIAECLNREGFTPPRRRRPFTAALVYGLLSRCGLRSEKQYAGPVERDEGWLADLAGRLGVTRGKLREWAERGWVHWRKTPAQGLLIVWADRDELRRLGKLTRHSHRGTSSHPAELTTPKKRPEA